MKEEVDDKDYKKSSKDNKNEKEKEINKFAYETNKGLKVLGKKNK